MADATRAEHVGGPDGQCHCERCVADREAEREQDRAMWARFMAAVGEMAKRLAADRKGRT